MLGKSLANAELVQHSSEDVTNSFMNSITALLRHVILAQSAPISLHTEGFVPFVSLSTV